MKFNALATGIALSSVLLATGCDVSKEAPKTAADAAVAPAAVAPKAVPTPKEFAYNEMLVSKEGVRKGRIIKCSNKMNAEVFEDDQRVQKEMDAIEPGSGSTYKGRANDSWNWECEMDMGGNVSNNTIGADHSAKSTSIWAFSLPKGADQGKGNLKDKLMDAATKEMQVAVQYNQVAKHNPMTSSTDYYATNVIKVAKQVIIKEIRVPARPAAPK